MELVDEINIEELTQMKQKINESKNNIRTLINHHLETIKGKKNESQKSLELCQVGKFLCILNDNYKINLLTEKPDFIISNNSELIGLEHETLQIDKLKKCEGTIKDLFKKAEDLFRKDNPHITFLANIWYNKEMFPLKERDRNNEVKIKINKLILHFYNYGELLSNPFIDEIRIMSHPKLSFYPNSGAHYVENITHSDILRAIEKKESKVNGYRTNSQIENQWLLIVIGGVEPSAFDMEDDFSFDGFIIHSQFNRIYLLHDFGAKILRLK